MLLATVQKGLGFKFPFWRKEDGVFWLMFVFLEWAFRALLENNRCYKKKIGILICEHKSVYLKLKVTATCPKFAAVWGPESDVSHNMGSVKGIILSGISQTQNHSDYSFIDQFTALNSEGAVVITAWD